MEKGLFGDVVLQRLLVGFAVNVLFGIVAFMREMVDDTGFLAGVVIFTFTYVFLDWQAYVLIVAFFAITGICIDIENRDKAEKGDFELYKAKRPMDRVLGRSLAGTIFAGLFFLTNRPEFKLAFVASYAESAFDTVSTKLGKLLSKGTILVTNLKPAHRGTPGGVSFQGTGCGILAAAIISGTAFLLKLIALGESVVVLISALAGSYVDSILNAYSFQKRHIPNEFINFLSSMLAGLLSMWFAYLLSIMFGISFKI